MKLVVSMCHSGDVEVVIKDFRLCLVCTDIAQFSEYSY